MGSFAINGREISANHPPYIIAEVSANHNGSIDRAIQTMMAAKGAGVSAVKIQTYTPDTMTIDTNNEDFLIKGGLWNGRTLYDLYSEAYTPFEWHARLFEVARQNGITLFSTPFDETAVDLLDSLDAPAFKVASFELTDLPLIKYIARKAKPMLMSTGMASLTEVGDAIEAARSGGCNSILIFHCISSYPTPIENANLSAIPLLKKEFNVEVGLSDHTLGTVASVAATVLGVSAIEKHFTLRRSDGGVDSTFSLEPAEMEALVTTTRDAHSALGSAGGMRSSIEDGNKNFRRSLYFVADLKKGEVITAAHVRRIRPGFGLEPRFLDDVLGKAATRDIARGDRVTRDSFE